MAALLLVFFVAAISIGSRAQMPPSSAPAPMMEPMAPMMVPEPMAPGSMAAPAMDCLTPLANMSSCLTFVEPGSNLTAPENDCCPGFQGVIASAPLCLCQLLGSGEAFGLPIDSAKAMKLPKACHVDAPPVSLCALLGIPVASPNGPASAPMSEGPSAQSGGPVSSGEGPALSAGSATPPRSGSQRIGASEVVMLIGLSWAGIISLVLF